MSAPSGWLNDPVGGLIHAGRQHLFYQYVPASTRWRPDCHWGHLVGDDLVRWRHLPVALAPGDGDDGVWSGSAVTDAAGPVLLYTSIRGGSPDLGRVGLARPRDADLESWRKHAGNPVLEAPPDLDLVHFRDPYVAGGPGDWSMTVGAGLRDGRGAVLRYRGPDLETWSFWGVLAAGKVAGRGAAETWECPQYVLLGERPTLIVSVWVDGVLSGVAASRGTERDGVFIPGGWQSLDHGGSAYALTTYRDRAGRLAATAWLRHDDRDEDRSEWSGMLSLPVLLSAGPHGDVRVHPHPDIDTLRVDPLPEADGSVAVPDGVADVDVTLAAGAELQIDTDDGPLRLIPAPGGLLLDSVTGTTRHVPARTASGGATGPWAGGEPVEGRPAAGEPTTVRLVLDRGAVEAWTLDGHWVALRVPFLRARRATLRGTGRLAAWSLEHVQGLHPAKAAGGSPRLTDGGQRGSQVKPFRPCQEQ